MTLSSPKLSRGFACHVARCRNDIDNGVSSVSFMLADQSSLFRGLPSNAAYFKALTGNIQGAQALANARPFRMSEHRVHAAADSAGATSGSVLES